MNWPNSTQHDLARERLAFQYFCALERGDIDTIEEILEQATVDPILGNLLVDVLEQLHAEMFSPATEQGMADYDPSEAVDVPPESRPEASCQPLPRAPISAYTAGTDIQPCAPSESRTSLVSGDAAPIPILVRSASARITAAARRSGPSSKAQSR